MHCLVSYKEVTQKKQIKTILATFDFYSPMEIFLSLRNVKKHKMECKEYDEIDLKTGYQLWNRQGRYRFLLPIFYRRSLVKLLSVFRSFSFAYPVIVESGILSTGKLTK